MPSIDPYPGWGSPPWQIDFTPTAAPLPRAADFAVIGGGFTGLAAAAWLRRMAPEKSVVVLEAGRIGAGASGRTGGMALAETAAGDLPGLGDVLAGFSSILRHLQVECDLSLPGAWEIARGNPVEASPFESPIAWKDSGTLRVVREIPGGTLDPGKLVSGLGRAAQSLGAAIFEHHAVEGVEWSDTPKLVLREGSSSSGQKIKAGKILFATNALSLEVSEFAAGMHPRLTLAVASAPLEAKQIAAIGLAAGKPFYTVDFPYLWGRVRADRSVIWGAGLLSSPDSEGLERVDIRADEATRMFAAFEERVRGLHPALARAGFTHRWGGPILFRDSWTPVFDWHPRRKDAARDAIVLGAFAGHGVALSSYLGAWAAEALLGRRELPDWGATKKNADSRA